MPSQISPQNPEIEPISPSVPAQGPDAFSRRDFIGGVLVGTAGVTLGGGLVMGLMLRDKPHSQDAAVAPSDSTTTTDSLPVITDTPEDIEQPRPSDLANLLMHNEAFGIGEVRTSSGILYKFYQAYDATGQEPPIIVNNPGIEAMNSTLLNNLTDFNEAGRLLTPESVKRLQDLAASGGLSNVTIHMLISTTGQYLNLAGQPTGGGENYGPYIPYSPDAPYEQIIGIGPNVHAPHNEKLLWQIPEESINFVDALDYTEKLATPEEQMAAFAAHETLHSFISMLEQTAPHSQDTHHAKFVTPLTAFYLSGLVGAVKSGQPIEHPFYISWK